MPNMPSTKVATIWLASTITCSQKPQGEVDYHDAFAADCTHFRYLPI